MINARDMAFRIPIARQRQHGLAPMSVSSQR